MQEGFLENVIGDNVFVHCALDDKGATKCGRMSRKDSLREAFATFRGVSPVRSGVPKGSIPFGTLFWTVSRGVTLVRDPRSLAQVLHILTGVFHIHLQLSIELVE